MRRLTGILGLSCLFLGGCTGKWGFLSSNRQPVDRGLVVEGATADKIVAALNANAQRLQTIQCQDIDMTCTHGIQSFNLQAAMVCQKPRNFRLNAKLISNTIVDMGSNDREFWWWISKAEPPYLFYCSYDDFARSQGRIQLPFQPDWVIEALGMKEYDPRKAYQLTPTSRGGLELVEQALSPQGKPVRKITRMNRSGNYVQVTAHILQDEHGKEICSALITQVQKDRATDAILPKVVELKWPAENVRMMMKLPDVQVNSTLSPERTAQLFTRPNLKDVQTVDLAQGIPTSSEPVRRAGGIFRNR
jgi:hypothetical protein